MDNLKLTIDLLPRGAWGNNLRERLKKEDWDTLRNLCYERFNHRCAVCGNKYDELDAHEVWEFDINAKTQTLKDIIPLCAACHGVKHMRNSIRIGYEEQSKEHFIKINMCSELAFAKHYTEATIRFEHLNNVLRWTLVADLDNFGGQDMELKERNIPFIENPYEAVDWAGINHIKVDVSSKEEISIFSTKGLKNVSEVLLLTYEDMNNIESHKNTARYYSVSKKISGGEMPISCPMPPKIRDIKVDNYAGMICVIADYANKIQWIMGDDVIKTKYNVSGRFTNKFSVENLCEANLRFRLIGGYGEVNSQNFNLNFQGKVK